MSTDLDNANTQLARELFNIQLSLSLYTVIGLNKQVLTDGKVFLAFVQKQSLNAVVLGLSKVFEKEDHIPPDLVVAQ
jgi:hypothetical protein